MVEGLDTAELCRRYGSGVLRRCQAILGERAEAEDAAQEVFLTVMLKGQQFRHDAAVSTWLYRVTTNLCLNRLRSQKRRNAREASDPVVAWSDVAPADPYELYSCKAFLERIAQELDELGQAVFVYRYLDGMSLEEIALTTGKARRTVTKKLRTVEAVVARLEARP